jgi:hypothetical protein
LNDSHLFARGGASLPPVPYQLIRPGIDHEDWGPSLAKRSAFYIRGTGYMSRLMDKHFVPTKCDSFIPAAEKLAQAHPAWAAVMPNKLHGRQFTDAMSPGRKRLLLDRAFFVVCMCVVIHQVLRDHGHTFDTNEDLFKVLRIEPAVSYLPGFDLKLWDALIKQHGYRFVTDVLNATHQKAPELFVAMANGQTVTRKLVDRLHKVLVENYQVTIVGQPSDRYQRDRDYPKDSIEIVDTSESR